MHNSLFERGFSEGDLLNAEARAVIDADFEEITARNRPRSFSKLMKDMVQWIKQRLQRV